MKRKTTKNPQIVRCPSKNKSYVGYCHSKRHRGWVTISVLSKHECLERNCPRFERCETHPLWTNEKYTTKAISYKKLKAIQRIIKSSSSNKDDTKNT